MDIHLFLWSRTLRIPSFFRFIYTDEATLTLENVVSVLYLAKKYLVTELIEQAIAFVKQNLSAENVCEVLPLAAVFSELEERYAERTEEQSEEIRNVLDASNWLISAQQKC